MSKKICSAIFIILATGLFDCARGQTDSSTINKQSARFVLRDSHAIDIFNAFNKDGFPIHLSSVSKNARTVRGSNSAQVYYQGELIKGIAFLFNSNILYMRTKGKVPSEFVYYHVSKNFSDTVNIRQQMRIVLENKYRFTVSDIEDSCDVWKVQKIDTTRFVLYNDEKDAEYLGCGGTDDTGTCMTCTGYPLSHVYAFIEYKAKIIVVGDEYDSVFRWGEKNRYNFKIPYTIMTDLDKLNKYLEEHYGIKFIKTKVLQKLKLIEFEN
jgi:hypothetical protein